MSGIKDYERYDALGLAQLIRARESSAVEVLDEAIARAEARQSAPQRRRREVRTTQARAQARKPLPDTPLAGVPFLIKDITYQQGLPVYVRQPAVRGFRAGPRFRDSSRVIARPVC